MKRLLPFLVCLVACLPTYGQNKKDLDSLTIIYQKAGRDTVRLLALLDIASLYQRSKPDTAIAIAQKALEQSNMLNFKKAQGNALHIIGLAYRQKNNFPLALEHQQKSLKIREALSDMSGVAACLLNIGIVYRNQSNYPLALENYQKSLKIREALQDKVGVSGCLNNIGIIYQNQGNFPAALGYYQRSLKLYEELKNVQGASATLSNIGLIYDNQGNYPLALEYHLRSLKIREELKDTQGISISFNNIALIYDKQGKIALALAYHEKSLKIKEELKDKQGISFSLYNIGDMHQKLKNYPLALEYQQRSLKICEELGTKWLMTYLYNGLAMIYQKQGDYEQSILYGLKGLKIAQETEALLEAKEATRTLYETYKLKGEYTNALQYHEQFKEFNDSLFNVEKEEKIANLESTAKVERTEKEKEILQKNSELRRIEAERERNARLAIEKQAEANKLLEMASVEKNKYKQDSLHALAQQKQLEVDKYLAQELRFKAESKAKQLELLKEKEAKEFKQDIIYLILASLIAVIILAYFIFRSRQKERISKEMLLQRNEEIQQINEELNITLETVSVQKSEIEAKNKDINDSIKYAERIQKALLSFDDRVNAHIGKDNLFIFYKPRNIVSGDFYFFEEVAGKLVIAVVDCTGHGVPGALMSMIGINMLDEIVVSQKNTSPHEILNQLHKKIRTILKQAENKNADGMDVALVTIDKEKQVLTFAGAKNPLIYIQNNEVFHIKGDKMPIGGEQREKERIFTLHIVDIAVPTALYLFSDGYQDQFGGKAQKKFMLLNMKNLLLDIHQKSVSEQESILQETIETWISQGTEKQIDDILVVGIKL